MPPPESDTLALVADEVLADPTGLLVRVLDEISTALPDLAHDPRVRELLTATVQDTVVAALTVFSSGRPVAAVGAPAAGLELARRLAQQNVPISVMLRAYRLGQAAFQQEAIARIAARRVGAEEVAAAARDLSSVTFSFIDAISEEVVAAYQAERDDWMRQRNAARLAKITSVLAARTVDVDESTLGYDLAGWHAGALLWCGPELDESARLGTLERQVPLVATAIGCGRRPLVVAPDASMLWVWFPSATAPVETIATALATSGTYAAVGDPARGLPGFRSTHLQAQQCHAVAVAADPAHRLRVTAPSQLGPLALLAVDPGSAAPWVQAVLGELADDDETHARMRETIWAYLSSGSSLAAAAAELHLHKNTIQYRIRKAEEARGRPLQDGRIDVEVALLACRLLGSTVLRAVDGGDRRP